MTAQLDHLIIPARDRIASAELVARLFGARWAAQGPAGPFSPVYLNDGLTLDFDEWTDPIPTLHFAFRVSEDEFDAILARIRAAGFRIRSGPHGPVDDAIDTARGGRAVYWSEPDGHVWEILTIRYEDGSSD